MTLVQMRIFLSLFIPAMLVSYILVMVIKWRREEETGTAEHWEVGCRIRSERDPHKFLPGVWMASVHYTDGAKEWERIA